MKARSWHVYILKCADGTLYTGATNDVARRVAAHGAGKGAKYTRGRCPVALVWKRRVKDRSAAQRLEASIKRMGRIRKEALVNGA
jgi:putative endonuclease